MSSLKKSIDYEVLESELDEALKADELYQLQNNAKFRAIEQRVPTYDHFRNMVQAAHLRPIERSEFKKKFEVSWNHSFIKKNEIFLNEYKKTNTLNLKSKENNKMIFERDTKPRTNAEFLKTWKNLPNCTSKFEYLLKCRNCLKEKFFKIEIPSEFLQDFFKLSADIFYVDIINDVIEILQIFSDCKRLSLSIALMSEKIFIKLLFEKLLVHVHNETEKDKIKKLEKIYNIS